MSSFVVHLLRHGSTEAEGRLIGRTDAASLPEGIAACSARARHVTGVDIVTSDLRRARAAAEAIGASRGAVPRVDARWRELNFGAWDGLAFDAIDGLAWAAFQADPAGGSPPEGERWPDLVARVADALAAIDRPTLVVTHGGAMRAALAATCAIDFPQLWNIALPHAALLTLRLWPGTPRVGQMIGLVT